MGNYNDLEDKAIGLSAVLGGLAGLAGVALSGKAKREKLQAELKELRYKLSQLKRNLFTRIQNSDEIQKLENRERAILKELNNL